MRKITFQIYFLLFFSSDLFANPGEGMWIPSLLKEYQESEMRASGMRLTAEEIYSINQSSLKDAILLFGGGCTGSVISDQGLIITNHHCGYSQIQTHSTIDHNYLKDGFWAASREKELKNPGLKVTFIVRIEDVTNSVLVDVSDNLSESARQTKIKSAIIDLEKLFSDSLGYDASIRPFYNGNEFYLFLTETYKDIRLVGAPPSSIGNFGKDTDNWMWPRHTADFSLFRIYAGKDNKAADYSEENVPWKPKRSLAISMKGVKEGDFTMVYGFPGKTTEYLTSFEVAFIAGKADPARVAIRDQKLKIMDQFMRLDAKVKIQYAAKYARIANYWKKWIGEMSGLERLKAVEVKKAYEDEFRVWLKANPNMAAKYGDILPSMESIYRSFAPMALARDYLNEAGFGVEAIGLAYGFSAFVGKAENKETTPEMFQDLVNEIIKAMPANFKDYYAPIDKELCRAMLKMYAAEKGLTDLPGIFDKIKKKYKGNIDLYVEELFSTTVMADQEKLDLFLKSLTFENLKLLKSDPMYVLMQSLLSHYTDKYASKVAEMQSKIDVLNRRYMKAQKEKDTKRKFYPDANGTLRVAWGKVEGYSPQDGIRYKSFTTLDGVLAKYIPGDEEFDVSSRLIDLWKRKDFGRYADADGSMHVCFVASNHTSGGNSGSPVLNGDGEFIGLNFDRVWEGTMSDIMFDPDRCRNIATDVRYLLWIIDKYAASGHLVKEMKLSIRE